MRFTKGNLSRIVAVAALMNILASTFIIVSAWVVDRFPPRQSLLWPRSSFRSFLDL